jgi:hypothetical protein
MNQNPFIREGREMARRKTKENRGTEVLASRSLASFADKKSFLA